MTTSATRTLHVVTHRRWVADDFAAAATTEPALSGVTVRHSLGLDLPAFDPDTPLAIWSPMEWVARARVALGTEGRTFLPLADPGPEFLTGLPIDVLGRRVGVADLHTIAAGAGPDEGFYKPANCKIEPIPAAWRSREEFVAAARAVKVPSTSKVLWSDTRLEFAEEHRVFVRDDRVVTSSPYLMGGTIWHETMRSRLDAEARAFAQDVVSRVANNGLPPAFVIDVGLTTLSTTPSTPTSRWVVIETNPVWSSGQYGADLAEVIECLFAANDPPRASTWAWDPDPYLLARVAQQRPLR